MSERSQRPGEFLNAGEKKLLETAIQKAEASTSGEIRVMISHKAEGQALEAAKANFTRLGMDKTAKRNGVLIFLAVKTHSFAILGDEGIHKYVGQDGWDHIRDRMADFFKQDDFGQGLAYAVTEVGKVLKSRFPEEEVNPNELSDEIVEE